MLPQLAEIRKQSCAEQGGCIASSPNIEYVLDKWLVYVNIYVVFALYNCKFDVVLVRYQR